MQNIFDYEKELQKLTKDELIQIVLSRNGEQKVMQRLEEWAVYQEIFDKSTDALFLTYTDSLEIILCNSRAVEMFEVETKNDLLGNIGNAFRRNPGKNFSGTELQEDNREVEYITHKGKIFWGLKQVTNIRIQDKAYRLVRITDITRQKEQERKKYLSDELYRSVVNTQQEMVCRFKPDTTLTFVNQAYARKINRRPEDLIGVKFLELIPPSEHKMVHTQLRKVAATGKPMTTEHIVRDDNGEINWHQWTDIPIYDDQGNLLEFQGVGLDVSNRVRVEKSFRESEEKFRTLVMAVPVGIFITDQQGNCNWINRKLEEMYELSFQEALGNGFYQPILQEDREKLLKFWSSGQIQQQHNYNTACRYQVDDRIRWASITLNPLYSEEKNIVGFVGIVEDFTERKLHEEQLLGAKSELEKALKAKDEFLSVVSHEIRTPLNAIIGLTHLMEEMEKTPELQDIVSTLQFSSNHLLTMVNDILDFSKIRSGKIQLERIPFDLKEMATQTLNMFQVKAKDKKIELKQEINPELPDAILGDPSRLGQILNNLISNAVKFTSLGQVKLIIDKDDDKTLLIKVEDSGIGMTSEEQKRIFEAFTQANATTNRKYGGTGLGLTITEKLVKLQNGRIEIWSEPGKGTIFSIYLPLYPAPQDQAGKTSRVATVYPMNDISVLYVEDVVPNQLLMKGYCRRWKVKLDVASSGEEALVKLRDNPSYSLVLMDIMMPGMDGYQTAREIRKMEGPYYCNLPIIALTASVSNKSDEKYLQHGMNDFVEKPIVPKTLLEKIISHTQKRPNGRATVRNDKNMFSLLKEHHEQHPEEYAELLQSTDGHFRKYYQQLFDALNQRELEDYRQISHKLVNLLMLYQESEFIALLQKCGKQIQEGKKTDNVERQLRKNFSSFFQKLDSTPIKSKNLLK